MKVKKRNGNDTKKIRYATDVKKEVWQAVFGILFFVLAILFLLASFDKAGRVGTFIYDFLEQWFGFGYYLLPVTFIIAAIAFIKGFEKKFNITKIISLCVFFFTGLGFIHLLAVGEGGVFGRWIANPLISLIDPFATAIILMALIAISVIVVLEIHITLEHLMFWKWLWPKREVTEDEEDAENEESKSETKIEKAVEDVERKIQKENNREEQKKPEKIMRDEEQDIVVSRSYSSKTFTPPPLSLLEKDSGKPETGDIKANANIIKRTLQNFGIDVEMDEISIGPSVTRYALKPAEGVKLSKIVALNNDLALALAAHPIRIEAPIPGKSLVGIEIPNTTKTTVGLATLLSSEEYQQSEKPLLVSLGKGISGKSFFSNLAKAPHMLIAGATGSGKSVTIHAIITSLLFRNSPENLKFIMIDPKRVELTLYNKIPHLLTPVITDAKKAILALKWAAKEMSRRYDILEKNSVRDVDSYHKTVLAPALEKQKKNKEEVLPESMPYIVIVLDELADIMQTYPRELESAIVRLAQMSRAIGIHLILSTQRPSVNVITGLIKANIPSRIALQVSAQIDSRTILDTGGAEKLLGAGDMLYLGGEMSKPQRLQSAYITETEVKKVVKYLSDAYKDEVMGEISLTNAEKEPASDAIFSANFDSEDAELGDEDELLGQARAIVVESGKASTSWLQRKLGIGYSRAAKLIDLLESKGIVGPANGSKAREVYGVAGVDTPSTSENEEGSDITNNVQS